MIHAFDKLSTILWSDTCGEKWPSRILTKIALASSSGKLNANGRQSAGQMAREVAQQCQAVRSVWPSGKSHER